MLSKFLGAGAVFSGGYAAYSSISTAVSGTQGTATENMDVLGESSGMGLVRGIFGGENFMANVGAEFGGRYISRRLGWAARKQYNVEKQVGQKRSMQMLGFDKYRPQPPLGPKAHRYILDRPDHPQAKGYIRNAAKAKSNLGKTMKLGRQIRKFSTMAAWAPLAFMAFDMVSSLGDMPAPSTDAIPRQSAGMSGTFHDTSMAYTQRQRALQAMHNSQFSGRSALGNEASLMHR